MQVFLVFALLLCVAAADPGYGQQQYVKDSYPMPFAFGYNVKDHYGNNYGHESKSDGNHRVGTYHVSLPDGRLQTVNYKADYNGYVADVNYQGKAVHPAGHGHVGHY